MRAPLVGETLGGDGARRRIRRGDQIRDLEPRRLRRWNVADPEHAIDPVGGDLPPWLRLRMVLLGLERGARAGRELEPQRQRQAAMIDAQPGDRGRGDRGEQHRVVGLEHRAIGGRRRHEQPRARERCRERVRGSGRRGRRLVAAERLSRHIHAATEREPRAGRRAHRADELERDAGP